MMNSRLAEFMPDTASSVSSSSRISPMTSAAPRCCRRCCRADLEVLPRMSGSQRIAHLDRARYQEASHMLRAGEGGIGAGRRLVSQACPSRRIEIAGDAVGLQAIAVLIDAGVGEAILTRVGPPQRPDADRDDLRTGGHTVRIHIAGRHAGVAWRIDAELHLQVFDAGNDFLVPKLQHGSRRSQP